MALFIQWDQTTWNYFQALKSTLLFRALCAENRECICFHDTLGNGTNCADFANIIVVFIWNGTSCVSFICVPCWKQSHCYPFPIDDFKLIESQMSVGAINSAEGASSYTNAPLVCSGLCTWHVFLQHHFLWLWHLPCIQKQHKKVLLVRFICLSLCGRQGRRETSWL